MQTLRYRITTLGCRVNHAEARDLAAVLHDRGLEPADDSMAADLEIVHSCTVTRTAAAKSRNAIRRALRRQEADSPGFSSRQPHVIVTGCYASSHPDQAAALVGSSDRVIQQSHTDGSTMIERFSYELDQWLGADPLSRRGVTTTSSVRTMIGECSPGRANTAAGRSGVLPLPVVPSAGVVGRHIRAELRIQDGCDAHCTFCIIPKLRRVLRSKTPADAAAEARMLVDQGHKEIVLTGIFIGAYGHETALRRKQRHRHSSPLADLIDTVAQVPGLQRLRISSMEPGDVDEPLVDAMTANRPVVVPHLHLPLQSGSDAILRRMNRQYSVGQYLDMIDMVNDRLAVCDDQHGEPLPPAITTDIICGFPGETDDDFEQTMRIARRVGYLHMHVFPYSARQGTAAARWRVSFVPADLRQQRVRRLIELEEDPGDGLAVRFRRRLLGREARVIVEQRDRHEQGMCIGRCDHYVQVHVPSDASRGTMLNVRISAMHDGGLIGRPVSDAVPLQVLGSVGG